MAFSQPRLGVLHLYESNGIALTAFESPPTASSTSLVLFVGGLYNGIGNVAYAEPLATAVTQAGWTLAEVQLSSSNAGWGTGSVERDARELGDCVRYFRSRGKDKIVLMGHSTGCQDLITYSHLLPSLPPISALILQAPVSDREYVLAHNAPTTLPPSSPPLAPDDFIPRSFSDVFGPVRITVQRWTSLVYPPASDTIDLAASEDFFSSDLSEERLKNVFGPVREGRVPLLFLLAGEDESYPEEVKKGLQGLLGRLTEAAGGESVSADSGVVEGSSHAIAEEAPRRVLEGKVVRFLADL